MIPPRDEHGHEFTPLGTHYLRWTKTRTVSGSPHARYYLGSATTSFPMPRAQWWDGGSEWKRRRDMAKTKTVSGTMRGLYRPCVLVSTRTRTGVARRKVPIGLTMDMEI